MCYRSHSCSSYHERASLWEEGSQGCKLPWAASTPKLALQLGKEKNWTRWRILLASWSADQPLWSLHHQNLMNVDSGKQRFLNVCFSLVVETGLFRCWYNSIVRCFLPTMHFNTSRSVSVSFVRPELLGFLEGFPRFLNSVIVLDTVALDKPSSSAVLVTEAPPYELRQFALFKLG